MRVLVVEDEALMRTGLEQLVAGLGFEVRSSPDLAGARRVLAEFRPDICITDMVLPDGDGLDFLRVARSDSPGRDVIVLTGHGSVRAAVDAMKAGAFDFLLKPLKPVQLVAALRHLSDRRDPGREAAGADVGEWPDRLGGLVGRSEPIREVFRVIRKVARSDAPVMIVGESGTGKEAAAAAIHALSRRSARPLVAVNCGAVSPTLIESELFGHEKGAFTGAERRRTGFFEMADGGTLFLDEVTEMSPELQVRFLRVLETRAFRRVGGIEELSVDVRIIASSNRDLQEAVRTDRLRGDLYYRLNVFPVRLPPLRERTDDIGLLAQHFLEKIEAEEHAGVRTFDPKAIGVLKEHGWPGNVRELRNAVHRAYVLSEGPVVGPEEVRSVLDASTQRTTRAPAKVETGASLEVRLGQSLEEVERQVIKGTLEFVKGNKKRTAEILGVSLKTIYNKLRQYGLDG